MSLSGSRLVRCLLFTYSRILTIREYCERMRWTGVGHFQLIKPAMMVIDAPRDVSTSDDWWGAS